MKGPVLIVGSRGFLARHLRSELSRRYGASRLRLMDHRPAPQTLVCDLLDAPALRRSLGRLRPTLIFHLAGTTRPASREALWAAHVQATVNLLEAVRLSPSLRSSRVVAVGSSAEYGDTSAGPAREEDAARPATLYGASKLCSTLCALSYRHRGLRVSVARVFNVVGPGMPEHLSLGSFARQIADIEREAAPPVLRVGNLQARRDYVDVRDVARALAVLGERGRPGEAYNICSGRAQTMRSLLEGLLRLSSRSIRVERDLSRLRKADVRVCRGSPRKLAALGWTSRIPIARSLEDTLDFFRKNP